MRLLCPVQNCGQLLFKHLKTSSMFSFDLDCTWLLAVLCVLFVRRNIKNSASFWTYSYFVPACNCCQCQTTLCRCCICVLFVCFALKTPHISDWCHAVRVRQCIRLGVTPCVSSWPAPSHLIALCVSSHPFVLHDRVTYVLISLWLRGSALL